LPYHIGWNDRVWKDQASEFVFSHEIEGQLYNLGIEIGTKCADLWRNVDTVVAKYAGPNIIRLILDAANMVWVGIMRQQEKTEHLTVKERYHAITAEATDNPEILTDLVSEFLFSRVRKGNAIYTTLDLPDFHPASYTELLDSAALISYIQEIGYCKFLFDKFMFLEGKITLDKSGIYISSAKSEKGEMYLRASKLSQLRDALAQRVQRARKVNEARHQEYKVVGSAEIRNGRLNVYLVSAFESPHGTPIASLRGYVGSEYLFRVLATHKEGLDTIYCWEIIYSLCEALRKAGITDATMHKNDVIEVVSAALGITRQRARRALDILTFRSDVKTRDGIWSRPVVLIDRSFISLVYPAIASVTPVRQIHHVIGNLNLTGIRGDEFQRTCDKALRGIISHLRKAIPSIREEELYVLPTSSKVFDLLGRKKRETDVIVLFGTKLLVCEAKRVSDVVTLREFENALESVCYGMDQISARISLLNSRMRDLRSILGIDHDTELSVAGLLISNEVFFDGFSVNQTFCISLRSLISVLQGITDESKITVDVEHASRSEWIYRKIMHVLRRLSEENKSDEFVMIREGFVKAKDGSFNATFDYAELTYFGDEE
jgi:hypothetical protein